MGEWREYVLGELVRDHNSARKPVKSVDRVSGSVPYYGASGIVDWVEGFTHDGSFLLLAEDGENLRSRSTPIAFRASGRIWVNNHAHVLSGIEPYDTRFLEYALAVTDVSGYLTGSAQPKLNRSSMESIRLLLPPRAERKAIAEVLGALDDKIAANQRTMRLCGELADLNFARYVRDINYGGETFDDVADIGGGGTPKTTVDDYWNGDVWWATPTDVTAANGPYLYRTARTITESGLAACSSILYPQGSILMTSRATIGAFAIAEAPIAVNQGFIVVNAKDVEAQWWLFHEMRSRVDEFVSHANGATFLELSRGRFKKLPVRMPIAAHIAAFTAVVEPLHRVAAHAQVESRSLARTRDQLLPLLMSGKLRVTNAEAAVAEVV